MQLLLVEDDPDLAAAVQAHLQANGHQVQWCASLGCARMAEPAGLALLDLHLPDGDGLELLRTWRRLGKMLPVIVLTARDQVRDRILGLQAGADDYLVKPFDLQELLARIEAVCRRGSAREPAARRWQADLFARQLTVDGQPVELTRMEWSVLSCLAGRTGRIYLRSEIADRLFTDGLGEAQSNSLEVIVSRLRRKLGPGSISTHRGLGYRLE